MGSKRNKSFKSLAPSPLSPSNDIHPAENQTKRITVSGRSKRYPRDWPQPRKAAMYTKRERERERERERNLLSQQDDLGSCWTWCATCKPGREPSPVRGGSSPVLGDAARTSPSPGSPTSAIVLTTAHETITLQRLFQRWWSSVIWMPERRKKTSASDPQNIQQYERERERESNDLLETYV